MTLSFPTATDTTAWEKLQRQQKTQKDMFYSQSVKRKRKRQLNKTAHLNLQFTKEEYLQ